MTEQELNEKIVRWCFPNQSLKWLDGQLGITVNRSFLITMPTESLDFQAQHVWPKLLDWRLKPEWRPLTEVPGKTGQFMFWAATDKYESGMGAVAATPARAAAIAIGKLIEAQP